ncbi:MAG: pyridoxine 5'-phosphate synthase [Campylobacteraceae bacterium 4484_166]|nr:MAG: pyridoxine 5'-phosphate synthase [Campylobacteraceae bacterium 4484_166]
MKLGVNIDHIAVLRQARQINDPIITDALFFCKNAGANMITIHLREDRRHINDKDVKDIISLSPLPVNLECSLNKDIIDIVKTHKPYMATIVPEKREELTTEGGLDLKKFEKEILKTKKILEDEGIIVSLFVDPSNDVIDMCHKLQISNVELHTGKYANIYAMLYGNLGLSSHSIKELELPKEQLKQKLNDTYKAIIASANLSEFYGIKVAAGHGLNYENVKDILKIKNIKELNIGQSIVAKSVFIGLEKAIKKMKKIINETR